MLTIITLDTDNAANIANAITAINITDIGYSVEGEQKELYFTFEDLTDNQKQKLLESLHMNDISFLVHDHIE
tara:strand:- start:681 stop:896 length:216 start_codon:yes stop_codon:yes gene_type:complete